MRLKIVALYLLSLLILSLNDPSWASAEIRGCNRTIRNSVGWIRWTGRMGRCIVRIRAPLRDPQVHVIEIKIRRLQVGFLKEARCEGAYFQFTDNADDPDGEAGRYCGHVRGNATRLFLRRGPDLTVVLSSDAQFASTNPVIFSAQFSILPARLAVERHRGYTASVSSSTASCPVECTVRDERRSCRLTSPGYPSVYPRGIRCRVALESTAGRFKIGGQPEDLFDLMDYADREGCDIENCEDAMDVVRIARSHRDRIEADESIVGYNRPRRKHNGRTRAVKRIAETNGQLTGRWHRDEKKATQRQHRRYRHKEPPDASVMPRLRIKSMRSKITRKNQRRVATNRYLNGDSVRPSEIFDSVTVPERRYHGENRSSASNATCDGGDYLAFLENVNGRVLEISKFCGDGRVPRIYTRGRNVIVEFFARRDGTATHDGFQVHLQEERVSQETERARCDFAYRSNERNSKERSVTSPRGWYPPNTVCTYKFHGRNAEKIYVHIKILRNEMEREKPETKRNFSLNYCPGNEIAVYNGAQVNGSFLMWSYCDASHRDINNIQVPLTSSGNELLIQYYSAKGSYDGQGFTYAISYRFVRKEQNLTGAGRKYKSISLRPVDLSVLNLNDTDDYNCDNRIDMFKNWFAVLVVFGIVSFVGAVVTIVTLTAKCLKIRSAEKKLLQNKPA